MTGNVLRIIYEFSEQSNEIGTITIPISLMRHKEVKQLAQGHAVANEIEQNCLIELLEYP